MSDPNYPTQPPLAEPVEPKPSRGKRVLVGAALVTAGLIAGGGATYAVASQVDPATLEGTSTLQPGGKGGPRGGGMGAPPNGQLPEGTAPESAAPEDSAPETSEPSTAPEGTA